MTTSWMFVLFPPRKTLPSLNIWTRGVLPSQRKHYTITRSTARTRSRSVLCIGLDLSSSIVFRLLTHASDGFSIPVCSFAFVVYTTVEGIIVPRSLAYPLRTRCLNQWSLE